MAIDVLVKEDDVLKAIADAIRAKKSVTTQYRPSEMAAAITSISGSIPAGNINLTNYSTTYNVSTYETANIVDTNLIPENIKKGVTILGITGTIALDTSDATATAATIRANKHAWVNGTLVTGTGNASVDGTTLIFPSGWNS